MLFCGADAQHRAAPCALVLRPFGAGRLGAYRGQFRPENKNIRAIVSNLSNSLIMVLKMGGAGGSCRVGP
jgi:hypothetical protein